MKALYSDNKALSQHTIYQYKAFSMFYKALYWYKACSMLYKSLYWYKAYGMLW